MYYIAEKVGKIMRYILVAFILTVIQSHAEVSMSSTERVDKSPDRQDHPVVRPSDKRDRPKRPVKTYYFTNVVSNCDKYIDIIEKKDNEIEALKQELYRLRSVEQALLRKELKEEYKLEMKKFENRQNNIETKSKAVISDEPLD